MLLFMGLKSRLVVHFLCFAAVYTPDFRVGNAHPGIDCSLNTGHIPHICKVLRNYSVRTRDIYNLDPLVDRRYSEPKDC